ncbi:hypothetical protein RR48_15462 [Papilio machaon]|uniref:Uncharacterized protein n=1 Tax=Papilio machaon TaxID=76193 RepID=A0A194R0F5_PAPMA|nr:hypothetical protein RR48_15462 [Papilio machaon]
MGECATVWWHHRLDRYPNQDVQVYHDDMTSHQHSFVSKLANNRKYVLKVHWMMVTVVVCGFTGTVCEVTESHPPSPHAKDMYVVRATVYQVGIITNKTDGKTDKQQ